MIVDDGATKVAFRISGVGTRAVMFGNLFTVELSASSFEQFFMNTHNPPSWLSSLIRFFRFFLALSLDSSILEPEGELSSRNDLSISGPRVPPSMEASVLTFSIEGVCFCRHQCFKVAKLGRKTLLLHGPQCAPQAAHRSKRRSCV